MPRYKVEPSKNENHWVCTDTENLIVCIWENHKFNDTQKITTLEDFNPANFMKLARFMREMVDFLREHHYTKIF